MGSESSPGESAAQLHPHSLYGRLGADAFWRIARAFYGRIERDPLLRPIFPVDLDEPIRNQAEFLIQYFGGPTTYSERKGHPRLRMRHAPYSIGLAERNAWVAAMQGALEDAAIPEPDRAVLQQYFAHTATFLMNSDRD
jgi:hemoglobin